MALREWRSEILVVDDHRLNRELVAEVLLAAGYTVHQAGTAEEGLRLAAETRFELILMDIGLPGMDGYEAVRLLKADPRTRRIPTVALTAAAMAGDAERALASGFDGYVAKPIHTRTFPGLVDRYIQAGSKAT